MFGSPSQVSDVNWAFFHLVIFSKIGPRHVVHLLVEESSRLETLLMGVLDLSPLCVDSLLPFFL